MKRTTLYGEGALCRMLLMALHDSASLRDPHVSGSLLGWCSAGGEPTQLHAHGAPELLPEVLGAHVHAPLALAACSAAGHLRALGPRLLVDEGLQATTSTEAFGPGLGHVT